MGTVLGSGIDLVENARIADLIARWGARFKDRVFLPAEQAYCDSRAAPAEHYAGRFAVKEAVAKAFGTGFGPDVGWLNIEVVRDSDWGPPAVRLRGATQALARSRRVASILVTLSHTRDYAVAHALLMEEDRAI